MYSHYVSGVEINFFLDERREGVKPSFGAHFTHFPAPGNYWTDP